MCSSSKMRCLHPEASPLFALPSSNLAHTLLRPANRTSVAFLGDLQPPLGLSASLACSPAFGKAVLPTLRKLRRPLLRKRCVYHVMASSAALEREEQLCILTLDRQGFARELDAHFERDCNSSTSGQMKRMKKSWNRQAGHAICFRDGSARPVPVPSDATVSCTTFNILAPIYKRINSEGCRESQFRESWLCRNQRIVDMLLWRGSSIICLQEFWLGSEELVDLYENNLGNAGYEMYKLARTNNRGDGLLTAIRGDRLRVLDYRELLFNDCGDRVAQFLHLQSRVPLHKRGKNAGNHQELLLVNTHLLFPHNSNFCLIRLRQVYKIIEYLECYKVENKLPSIPVILCGDWNGSKRGHVYKFLRSQGFVSSYDTAHQYTDSDADAHRWVSHRNHRGNVCGVDFIWLLNPNKQHKSLLASWKEAVFGIIKAKLQEVGLRGRDAFCFFKSQQRCGDYVTLQGFEEALQHLGLTGQHAEGLTREEMEELMQTADIDGNGVIDYDEFQGLLAVESAMSKYREAVASEENKLLPSTLKVRDSLRPSIPLWDASNGFSTLKSQWRTEAELLCEPKADSVQKPVESEQIFSLNAGTGFDVQDAFLFPPEVEQGRWPENYSLSDHAPLTAIFTPVRWAEETPR